MPLLFPLNCIHCDFPIGGDNPVRLYCCNAHRQAAYRARAPTPAPAPVHTQRNTPNPQRKPNTPPHLTSRPGQLNSNTYAQLGSDRC